MMNEITVNRNTQITEKVFWICDAKEDNWEGKRSLRLTVTDGDIQRIAVWSDTDEKVENIVRTFQKISGTILNEEVLIIVKTQKVHYSQINIEKIFEDTQIPIDIIFEYLIDLTMGLPTVIGALCFSIVKEFEMYTNKRPVTELEYAIRIQAIREAFETVVSWQRLFQEYEDIEHRDVIFAGIIIGSFETILENDLLLPSWHFMPSDILAAYFNHIAKEIHIETGIIRKIKKVLHAMYYSNADDMKSAVITNKFFKHS